MPDKKPVSRAEVQKMAKLSRLWATEEEQELFAGQFQDILSYMDILTSVDTENVSPLYSPTLHTGMPREDKVIPGLGRENALLNAPRQNGEYFIVPRIIQDTP
jgi:aspartyl-tRNA(Asn)/glutamyl-tRNA(Gln) amidotransferase subunit C